jgi:arsenate reductase
LGDIVIYHNPKCSKSRQTLQLLKDNGIKPHVVEYLKTPPDEDTLARILGMLGMEPIELMRTKEDQYEELGLEEGQGDRRAMLKAMVDHPILIERPIVIKDNQARIGRPPEAVLELLV